MASAYIHCTKGFNILTFSWNYFTTMPYASHVLLNVVQEPVIRGDGGREALQVTGSLIVPTVELLWRDLIR